MAQIQEVWHNDDYCDYKVGKYLFLCPDYLDGQNLDREGFEKAWENVFGMPKSSKEWCCPEWDKIEFELMPFGKETKSFVFLKYDDEFFILDKNTKTQISWYKHIGRANNCSNKNFTLKDLQEMFAKVKQEVQELDKVK